MKMLRLLPSLVFGMAAVLAWGAHSVEAGGTCTVRASQAGNSLYDAAANVDRSFEVLSHILFVTITDK